MKPLLVGESNPYGRDPRYALYPSPTYSAGGRLCFAILQLSMMQYMRTFDRANLCEEKWRIKEARKRARELLYACGDNQHDVFVLLGAKVCKAFGCDFLPFTCGVIPAGPGRQALVGILPHPSGLNRIWNDPSSPARARELLHSMRILPKEDK